MLKKKMIIKGKITPVKNVKEIIDLAKKPNKKRKKTEEYGLSHVTKEKPSDVEFCKIIEKLTIRKMETIKKLPPKSKIIIDEWTAEYRKTVWKGEIVFYIRWYLDVRRK